MDLGEIGINGAHWIRLARIGSSGGFCEHGDEPSGSVRKRDFLTSLVTISFSNNILHRGVSKYRIL
jgi:hypothetical protein